MSNFDIIAFLFKCTKRQPFTKEEIYDFVNAATEGSIADYQITAWLMAVTLNGMSDQETTWLTDAMAKTGTVRQLPKKEGRIVVDKHSSGGIGDKATISLAPLLAAAGLYLFKASGRGLGFTGGTVDKLASVGVNLEKSYDEAVAILDDSKVVVVSQTPDVAPADKVFYHLSDVTATVESNPLIASSIMAKKMSCKVDYLFLDVKYGLGAFCKTMEIARELAVIMNEIGKLSGMNVVVHFTSTQQPLGWNVGNALEILEVQEFFEGKNQSPILKQYLHKFAGDILVETGKAKDINDAHSIIDKLIADGSALKAMENWFKHQDVNIEMFKNKSYFAPKYHQDILAPKSGYFGIVNNENTGHICNRLGAGRIKEDDVIDYHAGIKFHKIINDEVKEGDVLYTFYSSKPIPENLVKQMLENTDISDKKHHVDTLVVDLE